MGEAATLTVPLDVDVKVGENWGDMKLLATVVGMAR
jgi:DNA polymerase I-like protein with 3'-5' exonuclease and polymerase domains